MRRRLNDGDAVMSKGRLDISTTKNSLRKLGADVRWLVEKSGVDPEKALITIGVDTTEEQSGLISTLIIEFDATCMSRVETHPHHVKVHGVNIFVIVHKKKPPEAMA